MTLTAEQYANDFVTDLMVGDATRERSLQTAPGISSLGTCKRQWQFMTSGAAPTDVQFRMSAMVGTAVHASIEDARRTMNADLSFGVEVHVTLPNGVRVMGHLDECDPTEPSITDYKTVDGLAAVRRGVSTAQQRFQRHGYYAAALQDGLLTDATGVARNVYLDRSGKDSSVHVEQETFDPNVIDLAAQWVDEVQADTDAGRESEREKWPQWCESFCPWVTACRGGYVSELITEPHVQQFARMIFESRKAGKENTELAESLREELRGVQGRTQDGLEVRWSRDGKLTIREVL